ncbi:hypothetical protein PS706_05924 [Pseudomonas fluorescens]|nr:hypothetical protein PS706_05924 [Pseudomonas fluorescens]
MRHGFADAHQRLVRLKHPGHTFLGLALTVFHALHGVVGGRLQLGDQPVDLGGGLRRALRQLAHFVSHHGKTTALLAGPCGFDGGVEGQQVGLVGHRLDHFKHAADIAGFILQPAHGHVGLFDCLGQLADHVHGIFGLLLAVQGRAIGLAGGTGGGFGVARDILHGGGHLVNGGDDLLDLALCHGHAFGVSQARLAKLLAGFGHGL